MMKKALALVLSFVMIISFLPICAIGAEIVDSGKCGENLTWTLDDEGTLIISGTGDMYSYNRDSAYNGFSNFEDYYYTVAPWGRSIARAERIKNVIIEEGVTSIGKEAFIECSNLESITMPDSLTRIEEVSFVRCYSLTNLNFGNGLKSIGWEAFASCNSLTSIMIPSSVTHLGEGVFSHCTGLTSVTLPDNFTKIGDYMFDHCSGLSSITLPDGVTGIGEHAFDGCTNLENITLPETVETIGGNAFMRCTNLTSITIPDSVTSIEDSAFSYCTNLEFITIPDGVKSIGDKVFENTAWYNNKPDGIVYAGKIAYKYKGTMPANTSITLEEGTSGISPNAFWKCAGLTSITLPDSLEKIGNGAFFECKNLVSITLPDGLKEIGYGAFQWCTSLESIAIPEGVKKIEAYTFSNCTNLSNIVFPDSLKTIEPQPFDGTAWFEAQPDGVVYIGSIAYVYKGNMPENTEIVLMDGTTGIADAAFINCVNLTSITIPNSVTAIETTAFYGCENLTSITIPDSVTTIGDAVFEECNKLERLSFGSGLTNIGYQRFAACDTISSITMDNSSPVYHTSGNCLIETKSKTLVAGCKTSVIPTDGSVENIGDYAFYGCYGLNEIILPETVTSIGSYAFEDCTGLKSVTIPNSVKKIGTSAFSGCNSITSIIIPDSVTHYLQSAFSYCENLRNVTICNGLQNLNSEAFNGCTALETVITSKYVEYVGMAFDECESMEAMYFYNPNCIIAPNALPTSTTVYGYTGSTSETYANEFGLRFVPLDDHEHSFTVTKEVPATCTEAGYRNLACVCGERVTETIDALGHDWSDWSDSGDGENNGRECARCHETETTAHVWNEGVQTKAPTCLEEGSALLTCTLCGVTKTETLAVDASNHAGYGTHVENAAPATCTEAGYTGDTVCNGCGAVITPGESVSAHGHDYHKNEAKSLAPDYGVDGYDYYECSFDASHFYKVNVPALVKNTYTVTFTADGEVVAVVPYTEGDKFVSEPAIPEKDNCTAEWAEYTLNDTDITVNAIYTPINLNDISDIETEKTVDKFENGVASITLSASAATRAVRFTTSSKKPVDVIMVLDLSGSMDETLGAGVSETKMDALKSCAIGFIEKVNRAGRDNRIALVGFASGNQRYNTSPWENTGLIVTGTTGFVSYPNAASYYNKALMPTGNITGVDGRIIDAINGLEANGATCTHIGLLMAKNILAQNGADGREKVVVLITDGNPTIGGTVKSEINQAAPIAVTYANDIKNMGVKLYTVGVDAAANENAAFTSSPDGVTVSGNTTAFDFNRFLNIVSTNYPDAVAMNSYGAKQNSGYYMGVNDTSKLDDIFTKIIYSSVDRPVAFTKCNLVDTLSADFTFTLEQEYAFRNALAREYNIPDSNISVIRNADGTTTIRVNGVPAVKTETNGKTVYTASVTFEAALNQYAAGAYATNTDNAFVEIDGEPIASFAVPEPVTVSADRNIVVFKINGEVYRIEEGSLGDTVTAPVTALAGWTIPEGSVITGNYAEFEATDIAADMYTVTWDVDGEQTTETYAFGSQIHIPAVADKADLVFAGFSPAVPHIMPARNMTFTAVFAPKHNHAFKEVGYYGTCAEGLVIVSKCACGETVEARQPAAAHRFATVVGSCIGNTLTDTLVCSVCGASEQHTMSFRTVTTTWGRTTVLDLSLEKNGTVIQPASGSTIKIMIPWTNQGYTNTNVKVTRVNEQGVQKTYNATIENGYLVFYADHFSIYLVEELDAQGNEMEPVSYQCAVCELNGTHSYETVVTAATCTADGYTTHTCPVCGDTFTDAVTGKTGHRWGAWTLTKVPSCTENGVETRFCANDRNHTETRAVAKTAHADANGDGICDYGCGTVISKPDDGGSNEGDKCPFCGKTHTGPFGGIIAFFHRIAYFFKHLFGG